MRWWLGLHPGPCWGAYSTPPDPLAGFWGRGQEAMGKGRRERKGKGNRERTGGEGEEGRGKGKGEGNRSHAFCFPNLGSYVVDDQWMHLAQQKVPEIIKKFLQTNGGGLPSRKII